MSPHRIEVSSRLYVQSTLHNLTNYACAPTGAFLTLTSFTRRCRLGAADTVPSHKPPGCVSGTSGSRVVIAGWIRRSKRGGGSMKVHLEQLDWRTAPGRPTCMSRLLFRFAANLSAERSWTTQLTRTSHPHRHEIRNVAARFCVRPPDCDTYIESSVRPKVNSQWFRVARARFDVRRGMGCCSEFL